VADPCLTCQLPDCDDTNTGCALRANREQQRAWDRAYRARWRAQHRAEYIAADLVRLRKQRIDRLAKQLLTRWAA